MSEHSEELTGPDLTKGIATSSVAPGQLIGHVLVGVVRQFFDCAYPPTYATALAIAGVLLLLFALGFRERPARAAA